MKKERIFYLDFIRVIAMISVIIYHVNNSMHRRKIEGCDIFFNQCANATLGDIGVALFFIISGAALMYKYNESFSTKEFFKSRFIAIYPMFWVAYAIAFLYLFYISKTINHDIPNWTFIFTVFGIDGYLYTVITNFYILGEWFLGCVILMYICFPILRKLVINKPKILFVFICIFYIIFVKTYNFDNMMIKHNFFALIIDFIIGMLFIRYIKSVKFNQFIVATIVSAILIFIPIESIQEMYKTTVVGVSLFISLSYISKYIAIEKIKYIFKIISKYSYAIFLVHHVVEEQVLSGFNGEQLTKYETLSLFLILTITIALVSKVVHNTTNKINTFILNKTIKY